MSKFLGKIFIKDYKNYNDDKVRNAYGVLGSILGIIANIFLSISKVVIGFLTSSIAVIADGINNISDTASSSISLIGFKLSKRPADKEHPFGHARMEYISSLIISFIIIFVGIQLIITSIDKISANGVTDINLLTYVILSVSIFVKICLSIYYKIWGKKINSSSLKAVSFDSFNDVIATSVILICALISQFCGINLDGYAGVGVAVFIIYSGIKLTVSTLNPLLGEKPDKELVKKICQKISEYNDILGIHDLVIHNYGPNKYFASLHAEVDSKTDIMSSHELIDMVERELSTDNLKVLIHMDPINTDDELTNNFKDIVEKVVLEINPNMSIHDFRIVVGTKRKNLIFDLVIPTDTKFDQNHLTNLIQSKVQEINIECFVVICFDQNYVNYEK